MKQNRANSSGKMIEIYIRNPSKGVVAARFFYRIFNVLVRS